MKAQVFFIESQKDRCQLIETLLRDCIYKYIEVERIEIDNKYSEQSFDNHPKCKTYLKLLKASILRTKGKDFNIDFNIVVKRDDETNWCYLGKDNVESGASLKLTHSGMSALFPAVAIWDRMVMVPERITTGLDKYPREFLWCPKPLDLGGVVLVDFNDKSSIKKAINLVGVRLKSEIKKLCGRYMVANHIKRPNLEELGALLFNNAKEPYLELLKNDLLFTTTQLSSAIVSSQAVIGEWSEVTLEIKNQSEKSLNQVRVRVRAPVDILETPVSEIIDLPAHRAVTIKFQVFPKASPYCPLEAIVDIGEDAEDLQPFPMPVILEVKDKG